MSLKTFARLLKKIVNWKREKKLQSYCLESSHGLNFSLGVWPKLELTLLHISCQRYQISNFQLLKVKTQVLLRQCLCNTIKLQAQYFVLILICNWNTLFWKMCSIYIWSLVKIVLNFECQIYTPNRKRYLLLLLLSTIRFGVLTFPPTLFCSKLQGQMKLRKKIPTLIISLQNTQNSFNRHSRTLSHNQRCQESINKTIQASFSSTIKIPLLNPTFCILFSNFKAMRSRNRKSVNRKLHTVVQEATTI